MGRPKYIPDGCMDPSGIGHSLECGSDIISHDVQPVVLYGLEHIGVSTRIRGHLIWTQGGSSQN